MKSTCIRLVCCCMSAISMLSCVRDDLAVCPPGAARVVVAVRDKNYDNAAEAGTPLIDENLPMTSYVSSLVIRNYLQDSGAYRVYDETLASNERVHPLAAWRLARNVNQIVAMANHSAGARQYLAGQTAVALHPEGAEGEDIYLGNRQINYPNAQEDTIWLYRTKGLLIIEPVNTPSDLRSLAITVGNLYAAADATTDAAEPIVYSGTASVAKSFDGTVAAAAAGTRYSAMLAPSVGAAASTLEMVFTFGNGTVETVSLEVVIRRNHITLIRPQYDVLTQTWLIEVMVDGNWVKIENLNIIDE